MNSVYLARFMRDADTVTLTAMPERLRHISRPFSLERTGLNSGLTGCCCPVNLAQIDGHDLAVLPGAEVQRMTHQMDDARLDSGLRKSRRNCLG